MVDSANLIKFAQYIAPVFTPRDSEGQVNFDIIPLYVEHLINNGVQGILIGGSAGDGVLQSVEERVLVAKAFIYTVRRRIVVIVHTGGTNLPDTIQLCREVSKLDVDGVMLSVPIFYPYSTYTGMLDFLVQAGKECSGKPVLYYHFPTLTHLQYNVVELIQSLCERLPNFIGLKFTSCDHEAYQKLVALKVKIFLGFPSMALTGAQTEQSAVSFITGPTNYINSTMVNIVNLVLEKKQAEAKLLQEEMDKFVEAIVIPGELMSSLRNVMDVIGLPMGPPAKPLSELTDVNKEQVKQNLSQKKQSGGVLLDMLKMYQQ